jgi:hypothetical protein
MSKLKKTNRKKKSRRANRVTTEIAIPIVTVAVKAGVMVAAKADVTLAVMVAATTPTAMKTADVSAVGVGAVAAAKAATPTARPTSRRAMNLSRLQKRLLRSHWKPVKATIRTFTTGEGTAGMSNMFSFSCTKTHTVNGVQLANCYGPTNENLSGGTVPVGTTAITEAPVGSPYAVAGPVQ